MFNPDNLLSVINGSYGTSFCRSDSYDVIMLFVAKDELKTTD